MPLAFGGQFAKTIIERQEVEGRASRSRVRNALGRSICRSRSKSVRGRKSGVAVDPENRGIYTQSDASKKSSRNIWSLAVVSVDQRY